MILTDPGVPSVRVRHSAGLVYAPHSADAPIYAFVRLLIPYLSQFPGRRLELTSAFRPEPNSHGEGNAVDIDVWPRFGVRHGANASYFAEADVAEVTRLASIATASSPIVTSLVKAGFRPGVWVENGHWHVTVREPRLEHLLPSIGTSAARHGSYYAYYDPFSILPGPTRKLKPT